MRLLIGFALTIICLGSVVALVIYADTHSFSSSEDLVSHTEEVLLNLGDVARQLDRIELNGRLYQSAGDEAYLRAAQGATVVLNTVLLHLSELLRHSSEQRQRLVNLRAAVTRLTAAVDILTPGRGSVREEVVNCRRVLNSMQEAEETLLVQRQAEAERSDVYGLARRIATVVIGAALILTLFGFLVRDAVRRQRFEEQISDTNARLISTVQRLEEQAWESRLLIAARDEVALCLEVKDAEQCTVRYLGQLLPGTAGTLCITSNSRQMLEDRVSWGSPLGRLPEAFAPESCCAVRSGRSRWRRPDTSVVHCAHFVGLPPERYLCFPLVAHGETVGIMYIECPTAEIAAATEARENTIASISQMAAMAIAGLHLRQKLESQSIRDSGTGLFNRSFMEVALDRELQRASRRETELALMMIDVDHFKEFNDTFGHEAGDLVLREVAEAFRVGVRGEDIVCRYGGEEFVIILPEVSAEIALERAELLRRTVAELSVRFHGQPLRQVTISVGVAIFPRRFETAEELLRGADRALYTAKRRGRNRVVEADSDNLAA